MQTHLDTGFQLVIRQVGDTTILDLKGRATTTHRQALSEVVRATDSTALVFNLEGTTFIDSAIIGLIVATQRDRQRQQRHTCLLRPQGMVKDVFDACQLVVRIPIYTSESEAIQGMTAAAS